MKQFFKELIHTVFFHGGGGLHSVRALFLYHSIVILLFFYAADAFSLGFLLVLLLFLLGHAFLLLSYVIFRLVCAFFVYIRMLGREIRHHA